MSQATNPDLERSEQLIDAIGGPEVVASIVMDLYERVAADPTLASFLADADVDQLHWMQYQFLACALDGPVQYAGSEMTSACKSAGITGQHFNTCCGYFADAMDAHGIAPSITDRCLGNLATYRIKVTGEVSVDG